MHTLSPPFTLIGSTILVAVLLVPLPAQNFRVTSVSPSGNATDASTAAKIVLTFTESVSATGLAKHIGVMGQWSGLVMGTWQINGKQLSFQPSRPYFPAEAVSIHVSSGLRSVTNKPLTGGFMSSFWARPAPGGRRFTLTKTIKLRRSGEGSIQTYGIHAGDVDQDGSPDICSINEHSGDFRLLHNDGCGVFGPWKLIDNPGQKPSPTAGADFNGDGWIDLVCGNTNSNSMSVFFSDGVGSYLSPKIYATGGRTHGIAVLDANADGHPDIAAPNHSKVLIFLNDGTGKFNLFKSFDTGSNQEDCIATVDANGDGIADIYCGNHSSGNVAVLLGDGTGGFRVSATRSCGGRPFHIAVGDVDGDGIVDAVTANWGSNTLGLLRGNGTGGFKPVVTYRVGQLPVAIDLGDLDGDGHLDCVISNYRSSDFTVYWNDGTGKFVNRLTLKAARSGSCATIVDFDRDGDSDIVAVDEITDEIYLFTQNSPLVGGTQPPTCGATLRVNNLGGRAGFGSLAPTPVVRNCDAFFGITGASTAPFALAAGLPVTPGIRIPFGLLNLATAPPMLVIGAGMTNGDGEATVRFLIPAWAPVGAGVGLQGMVGGSTVAPGLTNPESIVVVN